uniref:Sensitive to high expression protein 9, mitochondrial n=1 Tax=Aplanochytrium stocchinoi TaxID=215587 RepID=A0A7S3V0H8_9STRA
MPLLSTHWRHLVVRPSSPRKGFSRSVSWARITDITNRLTAYDTVECAKALVGEADREYIDARTERKTLSCQYQNSLEERHKLQQSINSLLHRKQNWSSIELLEFTDLCQKEHTIEQKEMSLKSKLQQAEYKLEEAHSQYMNALRDHYHEEQIWSEKGRRMSTYVTWGLFLFNSCLFIVSIAYVEPKKRQAIVEKVTDNIIHLHTERTAALMVC